MQVARQVRGSLCIVKQDETLTTVTIYMRAAGFHPATLGFPRRPVFLPFTSPPETNRWMLAAGPVKGGAGVRLPGFPVFCAPGYAAVTECTGSASTSQFVPTRLARIRPGPTDIRHGMSRGWVSGGQGCYRLMRGRTGPSLYREWVALATGVRCPS